MDEKFPRMSSIIEMLFSCKEMPDNWINCPIQTKDTYLKVNFSSLGDICQLQKYWIIF